MRLDGAKRWTMNNLFTAAEPTTPDELQVREVVFQSRGKRGKNQKNPNKTLNPNRWSQWKPSLNLLYIPYLYMDYRWATLVLSACFDLECNGLYSLYRNTTHTGLLLRSHDALQHLWVGNTSTGLCLRAARCRDRRAHVAVRERAGTRKYNSNRTLCPVQAPLTAAGPLMMVMGCWRASFRSPSGWVDGSKRE